MTDDVTEETFDPDMQIVRYSHLPRWRHRIFKATCDLEGVSMTEMIGSCVENELAETPGIEALETLAETFREHQRKLTPPKAKPAITDKNGKKQS